MSETKVLTCPTCGAKLNVTGEEAQVTCAYCGNNVIVPDDLRVKRFEPVRIELPQPQVVFVQPPLATPTVVTSTSSGGSLLGCLFTLVLLGVVFGIIYFSLPSDAKDFFVGTFQHATGTGFAKQVLSFGGEGTGPGLFQQAWRVAADGKGNVYVSDHNTLRIQRFDASGKFLSFWTISEKGKYDSKNGPDKLLADRDGNVYALWTRMVLKYDGATGKLLGKLSGDVVNNVTNITEDIQDIALAPNGSLLAISSFAFDDNLVRFDANGKIVSRIKKVVSAPKDDSVFPSSLKLAVDGLGNIFILDSFSSKTAVYLFNADGKYISKFGSKGEQPGQFRAFNDLIGVDGKSRVYVKDWNKLLVFDATGRYLDTISDDLYDHALFDFSINNDTIYVVAYKNKVFKLELTAKE